VLFTVGTAGCAAAQSMNGLIAARLVRRMRPVFVILLLSDISFRLLAWAVVVCARFVLVLRQDLLNIFFFSNRSDDHELHYRVRCVRYAGTRL
jgi:hypothetical protein